MDWEQLNWAPLDNTSLPAAAPLAGVADMLRSAVEEAVSAAVLAPVSLAALQVVQLESASELGSAVEALATFELMGAGRRQLRVAVVPPTGGALAGAAVEGVVLGRAILDALDGIFSDLLGDGLGLGAADAVSLAPDAAVVVVRLALRDQANTGVDLVAVTNASVPAELAAHVVALQALSGSDAPARAVDPFAANGPAATDFSALQAEAEAMARTAIGAAPAPAPAPAAPPAVAAAHPAGVAPAPAYAPAPSTAAIAPAAFGELMPREPDRSTANLDLLLGVNLQVTVEIGRTRLPIRDVLALAPGSIIELDKLAGESVDVLVNGRHVASGEVVVVDENFGVRITEIVSRTKRVQAGAAAAA